MILLMNVMLLLMTTVAAYLGYRPARDGLLWQEDKFDRVLCQRMLWRIRPRTATILSLLDVGVLGVIGALLSGSAIVGALIALVGLVLPPLLLNGLQRRYVRKLDEQLVPGIQTLASGVRAGLNLVQAIELVGRDGPMPLRNEMNHLLQEYEYGVGLDEAMGNAAARIGSSDYRLLFAALQTHRERGGNLGQTLDRIADSIREIQRLEKRLESLTAQGRATARWLGVMPVVVLGLLYVLVDPAGVKQVMQDDIGKLLLLGVVVLNVLGFLWIRKIMAVDI